MSLWDLPVRATKAQDAKILKKAKSPRKASSGVKATSGIMGKISEIKALVETHLGQYKEESLLIQDKEVLKDYIDACIKNKYIAIDTETDGLDIYTNQIAGICIYTYDQKTAYIPLNHISYVTGVKVADQLEIEFVVAEFKRLLKATPIIDMFNANFDIRVLRRIGLDDIYCSWDGYLAGRILNENEEHSNLKYLYTKYCLNGVGDAFRFDDLFKGIPFTKIPINVGYLYAAHDPFITSKLCDYQRQYLRPDTDREDIKAMYNVFMNIEMPCIKVVCDMEDAGIKLDLDYAHELSIKYNKLLEEKVEAFNKICDENRDKIEDYKKKLLKEGKECKLQDSINIGSPVQIAILLYDVLKIKSPDSRNLRGTGEPILKDIDHPIAKVILEYREIQKLLSTYIDKLPECVNKEDGRIHCSFNQYGAVTGRFASQDPNLQNIPSHNKDIRKMFVASNNEYLTDIIDNEFEVYKWAEIMTDNGWKCANSIEIGDILQVEDDTVLKVKSIFFQSENIKIICE